MYSDLIINPSVRNVFHKALRRAGFEATDVLIGEDAWDGSVEVEWRDPETGVIGKTQHLVRVMLPMAFPFQKPEVSPLDLTPPIRNERHQEPNTENGALCLYPDQGETWAPWMTPNELVQRVTMWFVHYHQRDWPPEDRPPDLHMYYAGKGSLAVMVYGDDWPPPMDEATGRFSAWVQPDKNRVFAANPVGQNQSPASTTANRIAWNFGIGNASCTHVGTWFRLHREPVPQQNLSDLFADIDHAADMPSGWSLHQVISLVGKRIRGKTYPLILALSYPGIVHAESLFLMAVLPASRKNEPRWHRRTSEIEIKSFISAPAGRQALMRRTGHTAQTLSGSSVCIFGVGSIGSSIALLLGKSGVEQMHFVDHDSLQPGNTVRHSAGLQYVGFPKTQSTRIEGLEHFPDCRIKTSHTTWDIGELVQLIDLAGVVVDATASPAFSLLLNELCVKRKRPAVYVSTFRRASIGRIILVRPGKDACLVCRAGHHTGTVEYVNIPPGDEGSFIDDGCGVSTVEASAVDIEAAANVAARTVLHILQGRTQPQNECIVVNEPLEGAEGVLRHPGHHWLTWQPVPNCGSCGVGEISP